VTNAGLDQGGKVMASYFYAWAPLVIAGTVVLLALPWLGLIALFVFALAALAVTAALVCAILAAPYLVGRSVYRHFYKTSAARRRNPIHTGRVEEAGIR
jgi:hypothetical protein